MVNTMSSSQKIIHVKKHLNSHIAELGEGLLRYPKDGFTSFKNYQVPNSFSLTNASDVIAVCDMYYEGKVNSECGTIKLYIDEKNKTHYKKL